MCGEDVSANTAPSLHSLHFPPFVLQQTGDKYLQFDDKKTNFLNIQRVLTNVLIFFFNSGKRRT